ncbi:outer membrane protein assembly factor BamB family protein [Streptodolium elevatio]
MAATAGCSGSGGAAGPADVSGGTAKDGAPVASAFPGGVPAGVRGAPLWSVPLASQGGAASPVGSSVAVVASRGDVGTVEFRDAATGTVRASVEVTGRLTPTTWHGRPALVAQSVKTTPSDGISPERTTWLVEAFDEGGRRVARGEHAGKDKPLIVDGRRIVVEAGQGGSPGALVVSDAGSDAPGWRIPCQDRVCANDTATVASGVVVHRSDDHDAEALAGFDAVTGARLWGEQALGRPSGADVSSEPELVEGTSGALVVAWYTSSFDTPREPSTAYSVNDPATGRLLATGPVLPGSPKSGITDARGTVAVVATTDTTAAWEQGTGTLLWRQAEDETRLDPVAVVGPVLYSGKDPSMAVDLRTKAVLQRAVTDPPAPVGTDHAVVVRNPGTAYVFAVDQP